MQKYDALLLDLIEQARAAHETVRLYESTIIPDAKRTLSADQESYANGEVEFDRIVQDFRNLLTLELGLHRSLGRLATAVARIQQAVATELISTSTPTGNLLNSLDQTLDAESLPPPHLPAANDFQRD